MTTTQWGMTSDAKKALGKTIRGLRERLLSDLHEATEGTYRLSLPPDKAKLDEAARVRRERLERWIGEQTRALPKPAQKSAAARFLRQVEKDAAQTLLLRLVYLRLLEVAGLRETRLVTGGWNSPAYKQFRENAPELVHGDESEGYAALLQLVFDDLSLELPGVFGNVRLTGLVPIASHTLRTVIEALNDPELESVWHDDTTLGWVYQYWNDPEREALDKKLKESKKLENHEIASKTQMFTERYMVEWLLQNSLGTMWLAMCRKHGWTADFEAKGDDGLSTLMRLNARRADWRKKRDAGEVALDTLMPIEPGLEARWKYWVPQPIPDDAVHKAPDSVRAIKLLDPACGSGHFLVIACDLLFALYQEEARHRGTDWTEKQIVESILEHNLHGIDIDPGAVQIAAAALMLKCKQLAKDAEPRALNLVAPNLSLASLPEDDPVRLELYDRLEREIGLPRALTARVLQALEGANHLGTLLKVDNEIDAALAEWEERLARRKPEQGRLFSKEKFGEPQLEMVSLSEARETLVERLEQFLSRHSGREDLGLRLRGEQLAAGVRFLRMVREGEYDLVVGNPPYQGTSKMADAKYVQKHYPRGKADLYAAFLERGLQLVREGGVSAMVTMRGWMFVKQYVELRAWLLDNYDLRSLGDFATGAFDDVPNDLLSVVVSTFRRVPPSKESGVAIQPSGPDDKSYDRQRTKRKRAAVISHVGTHDLQVPELSIIPQRPIVYWWGNSDLADYKKFPLLSEICPIFPGVKTGDNVRFLRYWFEVPTKSLSTSKERPAPDRPWQFYIKGAAGTEWFEPGQFVVAWRNAAIELGVYGTYCEPGTVRLRDSSLFFRKGISFAAIGALFSARAHRFPGIFDNMGPSAFPDDMAGLLCLTNSARARRTLSALNPGMHFQIADIYRLPISVVDSSFEVYQAIARAFTEHESHREPSVEFCRPGPSPWRYAQDWAQRAVDRPEGEPLPPYEPVHDPEPPIDHLSFAVGVALGRFGANGEGILDAAPDSALPHGLLYLSDATDDDSLAHPACAPVLAAWQQYGRDIDPKRSLKDYLQNKFFADVHRGMYENRPIYFPLSSPKKHFVAYASIHRFTANTLRALLADHLYPDKQRLEGELNDLLTARQGADKKAARDADRRHAEVTALLEDLTAFIANVEQCAEKGPPPCDCPPRERDARYDPDLDDGVMINSAALYPLLEPQWKDPKKWWKELASVQGKKDYDWSHLAARYFPDRVDDKCRKDPSLAVAHRCFWKYHPEKAYQWELRLQDEIAPDFKLDEPGSDDARAAFEREHADKVQALIAAEEKRRERKRKKTGDEDGEPQGELELEPDDEPAEEGR